MGQRAPERAHYRPHRRWQNLAGLRPRAQGLPGSYTAQYVRLTRLLRELTIAKGDGQYSKLLTNLAKVDVLILDDWGLMKLSAENRRDLLEVLEDRHGSAPPSPLANYPSRNGTA